MNITAQMMTAAKDAFGMKKKYGVRRLRAKRIRLPERKLMSNLEAWIYYRGCSHFVSDVTIKCIVAYGETSETRWQRP